MDIEQARYNMVEQQIRTWDVLDQNVLDLLFSVRREDYVLPSHRSLAFADLELPLPGGERMWQPKLEARVLQSLKLRRGESVLEIGTGSGYFTALLAASAGDVTSVEIDPALAASARARLARHGHSNAHVEVGDGARGWGDELYDAIVLTGSTPLLPEKFLAHSEAERPRVRDRRRGARDDGPHRGLDGTGLARDHGPLRDRGGAAQECRDAVAIPVLIPEITPPELDAWRKDAVASRAVRRRRARTLGIRPGAPRRNDADPDARDSVPRERAARGRRPRADVSSRQRAARRSRCGSDATDSAAFTISRAASTPGRAPSIPPYRAIDRFVMPRTPMRTWLRSVAVLALSCAAVATHAEDLLQIYREAQKQDPAIAAARSQWEATQERVPQARAGLLPAVSAQGQANANNYDATFNTNPKINVSQNYGFGSLVFSASQPLYRPQNVVVLDQAREQVTQSDFTLGIAQQDLIIRTAVAYFDVLLAEFNVELAEQQKIAVSEQLAQAKRNFEVGTATITDTNEAQAKYDQIIATEIQARNDLDRRRTALTAIIGRVPKSLKRVGRGFDPALPEPNNRRLLGRAGPSGEPVGPLLAVQLRDRIARGRPRAGRPPADARSRRQRERAHQQRLDDQRLRRQLALRAVRRRRSTCRSTRAASSTRACGRRSRCRTARAPTSRRRSASRLATRRTASPASTARRPA